MFNNYHSALGILKIRFRQYSPVLVGPARLDCFDAGQSHLEGEDISEYWTTRDCIDLNSPQEEEQNATN